MLATVPGGYDEYEFVAEFYDFITPYRARNDVNFYLDLALNELPKGERMLEIGCGTGRILLPIARAGVPITGIDFSGRMLRILEEKLSHEPVQVRECTHVSQEDMRNFDLGEKFGVITTPFRVFQHMETVEEQLASLACMRKHLSNEGLLVLDLFNPSIPGLADETRLETFGAEPEFEMPDGRKVIRSHRIAKKDFINQIQHVELIYDVTNPDGSTAQFIHALSMRYFFRFEIEHLLYRAGLKLEAVYSDYDRTTYGLKYPGELIVLARKR